LLSGGHPEQVLREEQPEQGEEHPAHNTGGDRLIAQFSPHTAAIFTGSIVLSLPDFLI
jgi:hypothetical protein